MDPQGNNYGKCSALLTQNPSLVLTYLSRNPHSQRTCQNGGPEEARKGVIKGLTIQNKKHGAAIKYYVLSS